MSRRLDAARRAISAAQAAVSRGGAAVVPGTTTRDISKIVEAELKRRKAYPSFLHLDGYPSACCVSVEDEVAHGVPGDRIIQEGDLVKVDIGACIDGHHADVAWTFVAGAHQSEERKNLWLAGRDALRSAISVVLPWHSVIGVGAMVSAIAEAAGVAVVRRMCGHGIGARVHLDPVIFNYPDPRVGQIPFRPGLCYSIEPILALGSGEIVKDGWAVRTADGAPSVHFEQTVVCLATPDRPWSPVV